MEPLHKRIDEFLEKHPGYRPWVYGCKVDSLSDRARAIWETLTDTERLIISRKCPFKIDRFAMIAQLRQREIPVCTLVEISGVSRSTILRRTK